MAKISKVGCTACAIREVRLRHWVQAVPPSPLPHAPSLLQNCAIRSNPFDQVVASRFACFPLLGLAHLRLDRTGLAWTGLDCRFAISEPKQFAANQQQQQHRDLSTCKALFVQFQLFHFSWLFPQFSYSAGKCLYVLVHVSPVPRRALSSSASTLATYFCCCSILSSTCSCCSCCCCNYLKKRDMKKMGKKIKCTAWKFFSNGSVWNWQTWKISQRSERTHTHTHTRV